MLIHLALQIPNDPVQLILIAFPILLGAIIGLIVSIVRTRLDVRRSDKAALKRVLHNQLELWHAVRLAEPKALITKSFRAADKIIHKLGGPRNGLEESFNAGSKKDQQKLFDVMKFNIQEELLEKYEQSVIELASVDPILTYKLTNKSFLGVLGEVNNMIDNLIMTFDPLFLVSESNTQLIEKLKMFYKEKGAEWKIKKIKGDIRSVAWRISFRTWLRVLWMFGKDRFWIPKDVPTTMWQLMYIFIDHYSKRKVQAESAPVPTEPHTTQHNTAQTTP